MKHLSDEQIQALRAALETERVLLDARLGSSERDVRGLDVQLETQDAASNEAHRGTQAALGVHDRQRLAEVGAALTRIDNGDYGLCEETDDPIPFARLEVEPTTRLSVDAMEDLERERDAAPRNPAGDVGAY